MKYFQLLFLVFIGVFIDCNASCSLMSGDKLVCDARTRQEIPFATVKVLNEATGTYTNENGRFNIQCKNTDSLLVTCVGYLPLVVRAEIDTIFLTQKIFPLEEITILANKKDKKKVSIFGNANLKKNTGLMPRRISGGININIELVSLIRIPEDFSYYKISGVLIKVYNPHGKPLTRLHLYKPGNDGFPGEEILSEDIIINRTIKHNKIDLSHLNLYSSERILYAGFESIAKDKNELEPENNLIGFYLTNTNKIDSTYFRPIFNQKYVWRSFYFGPFDKRIKNGNVRISSNLMVSLIIEQ